MGFLVQGRIIINLGQRWDCLIGDRGLGKGGQMDGYGRGRVRGQGKFLGGLEDIHGRGRI